MFQPLQNSNHQNETLIQSMNNIREIISRINDSVKKSQSQFGNDWVSYDNTFTTQQNFGEENDSELLQNLRRKLKSMRLPLNKIEGNKQLSTVIQESVSQSSRTNQIDHANIQEQIPSDTDLVSQELLQIPNSNTQKLTTLRTLKRMSKSIRPLSPILLQSTTPLVKLNKSKSISHIRPIVFSQYSLSNSQEKNKSRMRKGLSVISKQKTNRLIGKEQEMNGVGQSKQKKRAQITKDSFDKKQQIKAQQSMMKKSLIGMKRSVVMLQKKNESKLKNCLTRTNIVQFYMSRRINK